ncbi:MAG: MarC family protein, partial [Chloroflexota bacterium]
MEILRSVLEQFALTFVPIFVALDAVGNLPVVLSLMERAPAEERARTIRYAIITGLGIGLIFIAVGRGVFLLLGIRESDFLVAGGVVILVLATSELVGGGRSERDAHWGGMIGVVPIGTPLMVGPAVLTTLLILIGRYPLPIVLVSFLLNLGFAWLTFWQAGRISSFLGSGGMA